MAEILHDQVLHTWRIRSIRAKRFSYDLKLSHNSSVTDSQTDGQIDDDNHANSSNVT